MPVKAEACRIVNKHLMKSVPCRFLHSDTGVCGSNVLQKLRCLCHSQPHYLKYS